MTSPARASRASPSRSTGAVATTMTGAASRRTRNQVTADEMATSAMAAASW